MKLLLSPTYSAFDEGFNGSGIYLLKGLMPSLTFERAVYYGSSDNLKRRIREHLSRLAVKKHVNKPLQYYYNKHGKDSLEVYLLELVEPERLLEREQHYLDLEKPFARLLRGFNLAECAEAPTRGRKASEETRRKQRLARRGIKQSSETIAKRVAGMIGKKRAPLSEAHKERLRTLRKGIPLTAEQYATRTKSYTFLNPLGERLWITNLKAYCKANGLTETSMYRVAQGKATQHQGWTRTQ